MSRFDSLFSRFAGPLLSRQLGRQGCASIVRLVRGMSDARETVEGCIVIRDNGEAARLAADSGFISDAEGEREVELAILEIPVALEIDTRDTWVFDGEVWQAKGVAKGRDAAFKTLVVQFITRDSAGPMQTRRR